MTNYEKLNNYINFKNKQEMNEHLTLHKQKNCYDLNETDKDVLLHISRYSVRYTGVFYQKVATIAKALKRSESTAKRSIRKLEALGIIKRFKNFRSVLGGFGANIIQVQKYDLSIVVGRQDSEKPCESKDESTFFNYKPINLSKHKDSLNTYKNVVNDDAVNRFLKISFDEMTLGDKIKSVVTSTIGKDQVQEVSKVIYANINKALKLTSFKDEKAKVEAIALDSLKIAVNGLKQGKTSNLFAYLHGIINKKLDNLAIELINDAVITDISSEPQVAPAGTFENWLDW